MRRPTVTALAWLLGALFALLAAAGCGADDDPTTSVDEDDDEPAASCEGDVRDVTVGGEAGAPPTVEFAEPLSVDRTQCTVLREGDGAVVAEGDTVMVEFVFVNGRTGEVYGTTHDKTGPEGVLINDQLLRGVRTGLVGTTAGSRVVAVIAPDDGFGLRGGDPAGGLEADDTLVFVADVIDVNPRAEGTAVTPAAGLPTVELAEDGAPTIHVPGGEPPAELVAQTLIEGTGPVVQEGQEITAHYTGILWASGQEFDSTWGAVPTTLPLRSPGGVISGWVRGLVGQKVGSQVLLVIPPDEGYGAAGNPEAGISGTDTLVFVVDILYAS